MGNLTILNNRQAKKLLEPIESHWQCDLAPLLQEHSFVRTAKDKLYIMRREMFELPVESRINSLGMYFASLKDRQVRLSIEGAELVTKTAQANILNVSHEDAEKWIRGKTLQIDSSLRGFQIVQLNSDVMGCGYAKEGTLLNYVSKNRRIHSEN